MSLPTFDSSKSGHALRVLLVENNPEERKDIAELLRDWEYSIYTAEGFGQALIEDAKAKAAHYRCHVALVDMRLFDDRDPNDTSGLELGQDLYPTVVVALSAHGDLAIARKAKNEKKVYAFVGKEEDPEELEKAIREAGLSLVVRQERLNIVWPMGLASEDIARKLIPDDTLVPPEEVSDIVGILFPKARKLRLEQLGGQSRTPSSGLRQRSLVFKATEEDRQPVVVKVARAQRIEDEHTRYEAYIKDRLVGRFYAKLDRTSVLWDLGASVYDLLGSSIDQMHTFSEYYAAHQALEIETSLEGFFGRVWGALYSDTRTTQEDSLFRAYSKVWGDEWHRRLREFPNQDHSLSFSLASGSARLLNPIKWVMQRVDLERLTLFDTSDLPAFTAITHGDLLGDNIFVDQHRQIWVIDYERAGPGPILQDFVELEIDILTRLVDLARVNLTVFYQLSLTLLKPRDLKTQIDLSRQRNSEVEKAIRVITKLRELAVTQARVQDARQYYWGLLLNSVFRATMAKDPDGSSGNDLSQERTLLLGSLICHCLDHWDERWPTSDLVFARKPGGRVKRPPLESKHHWKHESSIAVAPTDRTLRTSTTRELRCLDAKVDPTDSRERAFMKRNLQHLKVVVASPGDVQAERDCLAEVAEELNHGVAKMKDLWIEIIRWETDAFPGFHAAGSQVLIDSVLKIEECDLLIGIFWKRFGTPVADAGSGTEHEFRLAYQAWLDRGHPQIMVYFNQKSYMPRSPQEAEQQGRVLQFKSDFPKEGLWWEYTGKTRFERLVRRHLTQFIQNFGV